MAEGLSDLFGKMFSGRERDRNCRNCGQPFKQKEFSAPMVKWIDALNPRARQMWDATVTENALPLFCIPCERRDLARFSVVSVPAPATEEYR